MRRIGTLIPKDYPVKIAEKVGRYQELHSDRLTGLEIRALAVHGVLTDRLRNLSDRVDLSERRLEPAAKISWTERQTTRIEGNRNYQSARSKLSGSRGTVQLRDRQH